MKKIIATVLAMVMALALCTTAFAAEKTYEVYDAETGIQVGTQADAKLTYHPASKTNKTIAYYTLNNAVAAFGTEGEDDYVAALPNEFTDDDGNAIMYVSSTSADADYVLKYSGKTSVVMYLEEVEVVHYADGEAAAYTNIGTKCGQYKLDAAAGETKDTKFYTATNAVTGKVELFKAVTGGDYDFLVGGKVVACDIIGVLDDVVLAHNWMVDTEKMVAKCIDCGATGKVYKTFVEVPNGVTPDQVQGMFVVADKTASTDTKTDGTSSPKTFDAGIAMYVGMALTSVAGSAVVIGKKKEF